MRILVIATLMFLIVITGWLFAYAYLNNIHSALTNDFSILSKLIEAQDWESAAKQFSEINTQWEKAQSRLNLFINHQGIHDIELGMARTRQFIQKKEASFSLAEIEVLKRLVYMLKEDESIAINNIL